MWNKKLVGIFLFFLLFCSLLKAAEEPQVAMENTEGRTEAVVKSQDTFNYYADQGSLAKRFYRAEDVIVWPARSASYAVGKGTDYTVSGVQKCGTFMFSKLFHVLDVKNWLEAKLN